MIYQKAVKLFADEGVKAMDTQIGDDFDVDFHEALMRQDSELEENKIVNILQTGYTYRDRILRYAKVITSTGNKQ
jgi:molecular chaperone GrpE